MNVRDARRSVLARELEKQKPSRTGHAVDLEGASDEEEAASELLEEDNALAAEATGEEDENGARGDGATETSCALSLAAGLGLRLVLSRVEARGTLSGDHTGLAVLGALDLLGAGLGERLSGGLHGLAGRELVATLLAESLRAAQAADVRADLAGAGHLEAREKRMVSNRVSIHLQRTMLRVIRQVPRALGKHASNAWFER